MTEHKAERAPWGDFPAVVRNGDLKDLSKEPEYEAAKHGDPAAALAIARRLMKPETVDSVKAMIGDQKPKVVPVLAVESGGNNKIPLMAAHVLADRLGLEVEYNIVQAEKVGRTNSNADHRLAINPAFVGKVERDQPYLIVDDTLAMGGTLASLRGYIENRGGKVLGAAVMTAHPGAVDMPVKPQMLAAIEQKHGKAMDEYWRSTFDYGIEQLTQGEAGHLRKALSVDAIRDRITAARDAAGWGVGKSGAEAPERPGLQDLTPEQAKAEDFRQLSSQELLKKYPGDKAIQDAASVYAVADKFAQVNIQDDAERGRFVDSVRARLADNLALGKDNPAPKIAEAVEPKPRNHEDDLER